MSDHPDDHPSQAEGDVGDDELSADDGLPESGSTTDVTDDDGTPVDNPSGG